ncbi:MAG: hypothetical protein ACQEUZ_06335 [Pseudomonadota bacterium]
MTYQRPQIERHNAFMASLRQAEADARMAGYEDVTKLLKSLRFALPLLRGWRVDDPELADLAECLENEAAEIAKEVREQQTGELA